MTALNKQALREAAEKATPGPWYVHDKPCEDGNYGIDTSDKEFLAEAVVWWGFARQSIWREEDAKFIAAANPAAVLALLDELEKEKGYASAYEGEKWHYHQLAESEGERANRAEAKLEAAESKCMEIQRDKDSLEAVTIAMRDDMRDAREKLEAAERRIAELVEKLANPVLLPKTNGYWTEQEKAYEEAITLAKRQVRLAGFSVEDM